MKNCCWSLNHFSVQKSTHGETSVCVKNISNLSAWRRFRKSIFSFSTRALPEDNKYDSFHTQEICVSACMLSSFPHGLSNRWHFDGGDSTVINVLLSIFQSLLVCHCVSISTLAHLSINKVLFFLPPSLLLERMPSVQFTLAHIYTGLYLSVFSRQ